MELKSDVSTSTLNVEKIFTVADPNALGNTSDILRAVSINMVQDVNKITTQSSATYMLSLTWEDTWEELLSIKSNNNELQDIYNTFIKQLGDIQKLIEVKNYDLAKTQTASFLEDVAALKTKYATQTLTSSVKNDEISDLIKISIDKNKFTIDYTDNYINFITRKLEKIEALKSIHSYAHAVNKFSLKYWTPEFNAKDKSYCLSISKGNNVIGTYKGAKAEIEKVSRLLSFTANEVGYKKDKFLGYIKADVTVQNIFFSTVDEAVEWSKEQKKLQQQQVETETTETKPVEAVPANTVNDTKPETIDKSLAADPTSTPDTLLPSSDLSNDSLTENNDFQNNQNNNSIQTSLKEENVKVAAEEQETESETPISNGFIARQDILTDKDDVTVLLFLTTNNKTLNWGAVSEEVQEDWLKNIDNNNEFFIELKNASKSELAKGIKKLDEFVKKWDLHKEKIQKPDSFMIKVKNNGKWLKSEELEYDWNKENSSQPMSKNTYLYKGQKYIIVENKDWEPLAITKDASIKENVKVAADEKVKAPKVKGECPECPSGKFEVSTTKTNFEWLVCDVCGYMVKSGKPSATIDENCGTGNMEDSDKRDKATEKYIEKAVEKKANDKDVEMAQTILKIKPRFNKYIGQGMSTSDALAQVAKDFELPWDNICKIVGLPIESYEKKALKILEKITKTKIASSKKADRALVERAIKFLKNPNAKGMVQEKLEYLRSKGLTEDEVLEALNEASDGALVDTALGGKDASKKAATSAKLVPYGKYDIRYYEDESEGQEVEILLDGKVIDIKGTPENNFDGNSFDNVNEAKAWIDKQGKTALDTMEYAEIEFKDEIEAEKAAEILKEAGMNGITVGPDFTIAFADIETANDAKEILKSHGWNGVKVRITAQKKIASNFQGGTGNMEDSDKRDKATEKYIEKAVEKKALKITLMEKKANIVKKIETYKNHKITQNVLGEFDVDSAGLQFKTLQDAKTYIDEHIAEMYKNASTTFQVGDHVELVKIVSNKTAGIYSGNDKKWIGVIVEKKHGNSIHGTAESYDTKEEALKAAQDLYDEKYKDTPTANWYYIDAEPDSFPGSKYKKKATIDFEVGDTVRVVELDDIATVEYQKQDGYYILFKGMKRGDEDGPYSADELMFVRSSVNKDTNKKTASITFQVGDHVELIKDVNGLLGEKLVVMEVLGDDKYEVEQIVEPYKGCITEGTNLTKTVGPKPPTPKKKVEVKVEGGKQYKNYGDRSRYQVGDSVSYDNKDAKIIEVNDSEPFGLNLKIEYIDGSGTVEVDETDDMLVKMSGKKADMGESAIEKSMKTDVWYRTDNKGKIKIIDQIGKEQGLTSEEIKKLKENYITVEGSDKEAAGKRFSHTTKDAHGAILSEGDKVVRLGELHEPLIIVRIDPELMLNLSDGSYLEGNKVEKVTNATMLANKKAPSLNKVAISLQRGNAYVMQYIDKSDFEYDEEVKKILSDTTLSTDEKVDKIALRVVELFKNLDNDDVAVKNVNWDAAEVNTSDILGVVEDYEEEITAAIPYSELTQRDTNDFPPRIEPINEINPTPEVAVDTNTTICTECNEGKMVPDSKPKENWLVCDKCGHMVQTPAQEVKVTEDVIITPTTSII